MKCFSIDIETTGLEPKVHDIIEFGAIMFDLFNRNAPQKRFVRYVNPENMVWSQYCLQMHEVWLHRVNRRIAAKELDEQPLIQASYTTTDGVPSNLQVKNIFEPKICKSFAEVEIDFLSWLYAECGFLAPDENGKWHDKIIPAGKNFGSFDRAFLLEAGMPARIFAHRAIDPGPLYLRKGDRVPPEFKLCKERCPLFEGNTTVAHNALDDAQDVITLLHWYFDRPTISDAVEAARGGPAPTPFRGFA